MTKPLLCKLGFHSWEKLYGLAPLGMANFQCRRCPTRRYRRVKVVTNRKNLKGGGKWIV